jgi:transposase
MKRIHISPEEKAHLETLHAQKENGKERDRIKAILLRSEGWMVPMISQALRLHESTIIRHLNEYREGKLTLTSGGSESHLNQEMTEELIQHLEAKTYHHVHEIIQYAQDTFDIEYTVPGMNKWLHRNKFSYKKPKGHPHKADAQLQQEFIEEYQRLKAEVSHEEPILFMDSVHPTQATKITYGWIRTGQDKQVHTTASRTRVNLIGAIQLGHIDDAISAEYDTINGESIVDFMKQIRNQYGPSKRVHLILDKAGYHRSHLVAEKAKEMNISLHFLPPYSPNLNPIERLWKVMNEKIRNNRFFKSAKDFKEAIRAFFSIILPNIGGTLNGRINDNFQLLKT